LPLNAGIERKASSTKISARVAVDDSAREGLELGQSARVHFELTDGDALRVPLTAIQPGVDGGKAVWVVDPQTRTLRSVPVETGAFGAQTVPILKGLAPDALVVAAGGHLLREGQAVTPVGRDNRPQLPDAPTAAAR